MLRPLILIIEDESSMRRVLRVALRAQGYELREAGTAADALGAIAARSPDVILLDLGLPDLDGLQAMPQIRALTDAPVIVISARTEERQQIRALDAGANDYVTKPFREGELLARIRVALRQAAQPSRNRDIYRLGALSVNMAEHEVNVAGEKVALTPTEFKLLCVLIRNAGRVLTHQQLLREVWGPAHVDEVQYLRVYMKQLREKIEADPARPTLLITKPGIGYALKPPIGVDAKE